jgi:NAD(P)-dependent dehydrogenase (short-subunit alcohol dehydrogenase family)
MKTSEKKVILITGVSSGIGKASAEHLSSLGHNVYGTCRKNIDENLPFVNLKMDVTDDKSIQNVISRIIQEEKKIDVLINNAGIGIVGPLEDFSMEEIQLQFDVNFFGVVRMCLAVIPVMKSQNSGTIINVSSLGGLLGMPFQTYYAATKFAIEGFSESMRMEMKRFNINTVMVEPGDIKTSFTTNRIVVEKAKRNDPELALFLEALKIMEKDETNGADPMIVAKLMGKIINKKHPALRYPATSLEQMPIPLLKRILPHFLSEKTIASHYHV